MGNQELFTCSHVLAKNYILYISNLDGSYSTLNFLDKLVSTHN